VTRDTAFWDTSALVPLCVFEQTSNRAKTIAKIFMPVVWWAILVGIHSAIARKHLSGILNDTDKQSALERQALLSCLE
jgi:hypothetical protein